MTRIFKHFALVLGTTLVACSSDDANGATEQTDSANEAQQEPLYAIQSLIFDDNNRTTYIALLPTLDRDEDVSLSEAREFAEYAPSDAIAGKLLIGSGEDPSITEYTVSDDGDWTEGKTLSFADYTSEPLDANLIVSDAEIYVPFERTNFVRWNPETFEILSEVGAPDELPQQADGDPELMVARGYGHALRDGKLFQPYYWSDPNYQRYTEYSRVSVVDTARDEVSKVLDVPCPHLHIVNQDKAGNIWLSNGQGSISAATLNPGHARNCFARIAAGEDEIDQGSITHFADLTDGREGSNFFFVRDDLAIFNVYHKERDDFGDEPEFSQVDYSRNYHLWTYDMKTGAAAIMEGIDYSGGQVVLFRIDEQVFLTVPAADYSRTAVYEILPDGRAEQRFDVEGWASKMFRVR